MASFSEMLAYYRKLNGMTQKELGEKIGVGTSTIGMYESGKRFPTREIEETIADYFNVSINVIRGIPEMPADHSTENAHALADLMHDAKLMDYAKKILKMDASKKEALYSYIDFLFSN